MVFLTTGGGDFLTIGCGLGAGGGDFLTTGCGLPAFNNANFLRLRGVSKTQRFVTGLYNGFLGVQTFLVFTGVFSFLTVFSFIILVFFTVFYP